MRRYVVTTNRWIARLIASLVVVATGCADPSPIAPPNANRTMVFINLARDQETLFISGDAMPDSVPYGTARRLVDTRGTGFGPPPNGVLFRPRNGPTGPGIPFLGARTTVMVHGASALPRATPLADTLGARSDVVNIRLALLAPDAPLVRAYVLPAAQPLAGSLNWVSTQSPYGTPLVTTFFRGPAQEYRVHFTLYAPGAAERLLASTSAFRGSAGDVVTVAFDRVAAGYQALAVKEPR